MTPAFPGFTRPMQPGEEDAVRDLLDAAFGGRDESRLVDALRKSGDMAGEMVLPMGERVIGYYALSPFRAPKGWLCLAPVAIAPELFSKLITSGITRVHTRACTPPLDAHGHGHARGACHDGRHVGRVTVSRASRPSTETEPPSSG